MQRLHEFNNFPEAFDYVREANHPVVCFVEGYKYKLYPSGRADELHDEEGQDWAANGAA